MDCGSDVSYLPARFQADSGSDFALAALQNCHGKKLNWLLQLWMAKVCYSTSSLLAMSLHAGFGWVSCVKVVGLSTRRTAMVISV